MAHRVCHWPLRRVAQVLVCVGPCGIGGGQRLAMGYIPLFVLQ